MSTVSKFTGMIDKLAISMAVLCAIHCLIVPILIVLVPLINTTFFVHKDFHLWMLIAVFPTTLASILIGCRKHKDRFVLASCFLGLASLVLAFCLQQQGIAHCESCAAAGSRVRPAKRFFQSEFSIPSLRTRSHCLCKVRYLAATSP